MTEQFQDPAPGGDKLPLGELDGSLLLFTVNEALTDVQTTFGPSNPVRADVAVLDGTHKGEVFGDTLVFPRILASSLRPHVGLKVLGRLGRGNAKPGQSPPWQLSPATDADRMTGEKYIAYLATLAPVPDRGDPEASF